MHGISAQYVDGLELRIRKLEAENAELKQLLTVAWCPNYGSSHDQHPCQWCDERRIAIGGD